MMACHSVWKICTRPDAQLWTMFDTPLNAVSIFSCMHKLFEHVCLSPWLTQQLADALLKHSGNVPQRASVLEFWGMLIPAVTFTPAESCNLTLEFWSAV